MNVQKQQHCVSGFGKQYWSVCLCVALYFCSVRYIKSSLVNGGVENRPHCTCAL